MKVFRISYAWWEEYSFIEFCHKTKTQEEFKKDLIKIFPLIVEKAILYSKLKDTYIDIQVLLKTLKDILLNYEYGYFELELEGNIYLACPSSTIRSSKSKYAHNDFSFKTKLAEIFSTGVTDNLMRRIYNQNKKIDNED